MRRALMVFAGAGSLFCLMSLSAPAAIAAGCDHIKDTFAYNECLAKQAPPRAQRVRGASGGADPESSVRSRGADPNAGLAARGVSIDRKGRGRVRAVIDPWAGARTPVTTARKKRR
jgi:hypothetical protein